MFSKVLMCPPNYFKIAYKINPWMDGVVDSNVAMRQWLELKKFLENCGIEVLTIEPQPDLPDMVFACNAGLVYGKSVYLANFRYKERRGERWHFEKWFKENGLQVFSDTEYFFEGGGDAVFSSNSTLWAGYGFRSEKNAYQNIARLGDFRVMFCELVDSWYYHMDMCLCPLSSDLALWYPDAFSVDTKAQFKSEMDLIEVSKDEVDKFACNAIAVGKTVILPAGCNEVKEAILSHGFEIIEVEMSEFMKSGGAVQCLILKL
ncbi:amidinotransferase family protein [Trichuris trichiura]|uniref:Amidinotransferase family protein n=1 Tax=Trichuris trichiura TaxID=36087 RepID=A0A077ZEL3_TRITR|nr:amidinotransferase family protein [Trichuris trichiura]